MRHRDFRLLLVGRLMSAFGNQMLTFAVGWELWLRTHSAFALGLVGLVEVIPVILLSLPAGHVADQRNRRRIVLVAQTGLLVCVLSLMFLSMLNGPVFLMYLTLFGIGVARAFNEPASATLIPLTVPAEDFSNAATWGSSMFQTASIVGPAVAGLIVSLFRQVWLVYLFAFLSATVFFAMVWLIRGRQVVLPKRAATVAALTEGFRFIRKNKVILAAITLDLFAVLFGGAVALLPIYATDILKVGPDGLGILRSASSIGALLTSVIIAHRPPFRKAGKALLWAVTGFGVATVIFGLSTSFLLSVVLLAVLGGLDMISVVIRSTLMLTQVPDEMRGRASAVNSIFIASSNEMGDFESGVVAGICGPVFAVVSGGIGTVLVVLAVVLIWPQIRRFGSLKSAETNSSP